MSKRVVERGTLSKPGPEKPGKWAGSGQRTAGKATRDNSQISPNDNVIGQVSTQQLAATAEVGLGLLFFLLCMDGLGNGSAIQTSVFPSLHKNIISNSAVSFHDTSCHGPKMTFVM